MFLQSGDNAKISHALAEANIQSRFKYALEVKLDWLIDTADHTGQGFIVNKNCDDINNFFLCDGHGVSFEKNHFWLFIDNNDINESTVVRMIIYEILI